MRQLIIDISLSQDVTYNQFKAADENTFVHE